MQNCERLQASESNGFPAHCLANPFTRVLVVDDDLAICRLCVDILTTAGFQVDTAQDGASGWDALLAGAYDLLIADHSNHSMPSLSGIDLIKKVRAAHLPVSVIMMSGLMPTEELDHNAWLQPLAMLEKPFTTGQFLATVNEVLARPLLATAYGEMFRIHYQE